MKLKHVWPVWAIGLFAATSLSGNGETSSRVYDLEAFIVEETAQTQIETLTPLSIRADSLFGGDRSVLEIPRAVNFLSEELLDLVGIDSYDDLDRIGAGTQRVNYFGLAGSAFLRGARAGTYFNGMLRAYQRNEMPMSFGALDGLEVIKGPVPANFSPTLVGGAINQRPKRPFFDKARGSLEVGTGSWNERRGQLDYGAPVIIAGRPTAFRISLTRQRSDRFYDNVQHDFDSVYAVAKSRLSERNRLFVGGEYYDYRSSEVPGMNRPTPELIRDRSYVIGEPAALVSGEWGGSTVRPLLQFPYTLVLNPALFALAVPGEVARAEIEPHLLATMLDLRDEAVRSRLYQTLPVGEVPPFAAWAIPEADSFLQQVDQGPQDAYLYTPAYFEAGGTALTRRISREKVLADPRDRADSRNFIGFADLETRLGTDDLLLNRVFFERLETEKASTYGFAMNTRQTVLNYRGEWQKAFAAEAAYFQAGVDLRYTDARMLQDFDAEPFSRRDLTRESISPNSVVAAGGQRGPDGLNFWSSFGNASQDSQLIQAAVFLHGGHAFNERLTLHYGVRLEEAWWKTALPDAVDRVSPAQRSERSLSGRTELWQVHLNPLWEVHEGVFLYAAAQLGKALAPGDGGTVSGDGSFTDVELFEGGLKLSLLDGGLFLSFSAYHWDQASFSNRDAAARPLRGKGFEAELVYAPTESLSFLGAFTAQRVNLRSDVLGFGALPQTETGWALNGGILNAADGRLAPENPEMVFAGLPEVSAHLYAVFDFGDGFRVSGGPIWRDGYYHDMQRSIRIPGHVLWDARFSYTANRWSVELALENLLDTFYWIGQEPVFSAGTLVLQGPGRRISARFRMEF